MSIILNKIWETTKTNWKIILVIVAAAIVGWKIYGFFTRENELLGKLNAMQKIHDEEIASINKAHEEERIRHEQNVKKLEDELKHSQEDYENAKKDLDVKKKELIAKTMKKYGEDPTSLADKVHELTGFQVVLPESKK